MLEITGCLWPLQKQKYIDKITKQKQEKCSAFIATGSATKDGKIVMAHSTFDEFWNQQWGNVLLNIKTDDNQELFMQTFPGYIWSSTDFFINSNKVFGLETSFAGFNSYDKKKTPMCIRSRLAMQYAKSIDEFVEIINKNNNGALACAWLIGDAKTNEIARFEQGYLFQSLKKKKDGFFFGCNFPFDSKIRNLECSYTGYDDIRRHTGARKVRIPKMLNEYLGKIDLNKAKVIIADHYDVYLKKVNPSARTVCSHYDNDPRYYMSSQTAVNPDPCTPAGALDAKITTSDLVNNMEMLAIYGRACGEPFYVDKFLKMNPQWNWQRKYLKDRPKQSWQKFSK